MLQAHLELPQADGSTLHSMLFRSVWACPQRHPADYLRQLTSAHKANRLSRAFRLILCPYRTGFQDSPIEPLLLSRNMPKPRLIFLKLQKP